MVITFAKNQTMVCIGAQAKVIFTDPVPLGNNDRLSAMLNTHIIEKTAGTTLTLSYTAQVSNDGGQNYVAVAAVADSTTATGVEQVVGAISGALVRFKYMLQNAGASAGDVGTCCFDLHVEMDHA